MSSRIRIAFAALSLLTLSINAAPLAAHPPSNGDHEPIGHAPHPAHPGVGHPGPSGFSAALAGSVPERSEPVLLTAGNLTFRTVPGWCQLPDAKPIGNTHGTIVIDRAGLVYYNTDTARSIMVHEPDGTFVRSFGPELSGIHDMELRVEKVAAAQGAAMVEKQFIYAAHLKGKRTLKLNLDGSIVWARGVPTKSGKYDDDPNAFRPTAIAVAPDGAVYVADGYGRNWIHQYDRAGAYARSFGGPGDAPGRFRTCHGMTVDTRGERPLLLVCDRENRRIQRFDLDGTFVDVVTTGLRRPCGLSLHGDYVAVAELEGRVTILDDEFAITGHVGDNPDRSQWARNGVPPAQWTDGVFTAPHGCCFDRDGNLYVMDWNASGRITKLMRVRGDNGKGKNKGDAGH